MNKPSHKKDVEKTETIQTEVNWLCTQKKSFTIAAFAIPIIFYLTGCQLAAPYPPPPDEYLEEALTWLEANAVTAGNVDWEAVRASSSAARKAWIATRSCIIVQ